jgi:hypothetical protein
MYDGLENEAETPSPPSSEPNKRPDSSRPLKPSPPVYYHMKKR